MENKAHVEGSSRQEGCENVLKMDNQSAPVESVPSYTLSKGEILAPFFANIPKRGLYAANDLSDLD